MSVIGARSQSLVVVIKFVVLIMVVHIYSIAFVVLIRLVGTDMLGTTNGRCDIAVLPYCIAISGHFFSFISAYGNELAGIVVSVTLRNDGFAYLDLKIGCKSGSIESIGTCNIACCFQLFSGEIKTDFWFSYLMDSSCVLPSISTDNLTNLFLSS